MKPNSGKAKARKRDVQPQWKLDVNGHILVAALRDETAAHVRKIIQKELDGDYIGKLRVTSVKAA